MEIINKALAALQEFYLDHHQGKSMDYTYGYMDALGVLREVLDAARKE